MLPFSTLAKPNTIVLILSYLALGVIFTSCQNDNDIDPYPFLELSTQQLVIDSEDNVLSISNTGNVAITWTLNSPDTELSISPYTGVLNPGETSQAAVKVFKDQLAEGVYSMSINLTTDQEIYYQVEVQVPVFEEKRWIIDEQLVDVEYDSEHDRLIAINNKNELLLIDPFSQQVERIPLSFPGVCVSVSQDGRFATVGHIAAFSRVNLEQRKVVKEQGLPTEVFDLVEAPNQWVYINSNFDYFNSMYNFNLETGEQGWSTYSGVSLNSILRLSPNGKYIYSLPMNTFPGNVIKLSTSTGSPSFVNASPYHGDYSFGNNFWISKDGQKLLANSGNIFVLSENPTFDLTYYGNIQTDGTIKVMSQLESDKKICAVIHTSTNYPNVERNFLALYSNSLVLLEEIDLPPFIYQDGQGFYNVADTEIVYAFPSLDDKSYVIISKSNLSYSNEQKFAIQLVSLD